MTGEISHQESCLNIPLPCCCHDDLDDEEYDDKDESIGEGTSKLLKKGTWLLKSGSVHDPQQNLDENNYYYILRGYVHHSMKNLL